MLTRGRHFFTGWSSVVHFCTTQLIRSKTNTQEDCHDQCFWSYIKHVTAHIIGNSVKQHGNNTLKALACFRPTISFVSSETGLNMLHLLLRHGPAICGEDRLVRCVVWRVLGDNPQPWKQKFAQLSLKLVILPMIRHNPFFVACVTQKVIMLYLLSADRPQRLGQLTIFIKAVFSVACMWLLSCTGLVETASINDSAVRHHDMIAGADDYCQLAAID